MTGEDDDESGRPGWVDSWRDERTRPPRRTAAPLQMDFCLRLDLEGTYVLGFVEGKPRAADGDGFMLLSKDGGDRWICCRDFRFGSCAAPRRFFG